MVGRRETADKRHSQISGVAAEEAAHSTVCIPYIDYSPAAEPTERAL